MKPTNLLFGFGDLLDDATKSIYVVDFGLSRKYVDQRGHHVELRRN